MRVDAWGNDQFDVHCNFKVNSYHFAIDLQNADLLKVAGSAAIATPPRHGLFSHTLTLFHVSSPPNAMCSFPFPFPLQRWLFPPTAGVGVRPSEGGVFSSGDIWPVPRPTPRRPMPDLAAARVDVRQLPRRAAAGHPPPRCRTARRPGASHKGPSVAETLSYSLRLGGGGVTGEETGQPPLLRQNYGGLSTETGLHTAVPSGNPTRIFFCILVVSDCM